MTDDKHPVIRGGHRSPTDPRLLADPLDCMAEDHLREREICTLIDRIAAADVPDLEEIGQVLAYMKKELATHSYDKDCDFYLLMRRRCKPEDAIDKVIDRLQADYRHARDDRPKTIAILESVAGANGTLSAAARGVLISYASHARRHLIAENAIILPIARARLTVKDRDALRLQMLRRRGLDRQMETPDAD